MLRRFCSIFVFGVLVFGLLAAPAAVYAQTEQPPADSNDLMVYTSYPSQVSGFGEVVSFDLKLATATKAQTVSLSMDQLPKGWTATFRGSGKIVQSVYVRPGVESTVELRLEQPKDLKAGAYQFLVVATGSEGKAEMPLELTIKEKVPSKLTVQIDLPTLKGTPTTTFRFDTSLNNEGAEDMTVNLSGAAPQGFTLNFKLGAQDVTDFPLNAGETKRISIELQPYGEISAGSYPFTVHAQSATTQASIDLVAEVSGQPSLSVTAPDGRLSGQATAGRETSLKVVIQNTGSAPARQVELSATAPTGWKVDFDTKSIEEIPAGQQVEATAKILPADKAVAGDYVVSFRAAPAEGGSKSADFRITVTTSTLWGIVGIALIAVAVGVVAMAVMRFGRR